MKTLTAVLWQFPAFNLFYFYFGGVVSYTTLFERGKKGEALHGEEISIPKWGAHWSRVFCVVKYVWRARMCLSAWVSLLKPLWKQHSWQQSRTGRHSPADSSTQTQLARLQTPTAFLSVSPRCSQVLFLLLWFSLTSFSLWSLLLPPFFKSMQEPPRGLLWDNVSFEYILLFVQHEGALKGTAVMKPLPSLGMFVVLKTKSPPKVISNKCDFIVSAVHQFYYLLFYFFLPWTKYCTVSPLKATLHFHLDDEELTGYANETLASPSVIWRFRLFFFFVCFLLDTQGDAACSQQCQKH